MDTKRMGAYGIDAPPVVRTFAIIGGVLLLVTPALFLFRVPVVPWIALIGAAFAIATLATLLHTTLAGKFRVWSEILARLGLRGDENLLDVGCGRGAVLVAAAHRLGGGRATGVDLWSGDDQSGNSPAATLANATAEGVRERVRVVTGDATSLPFRDGAFDVVLSSMAIHNLRDATQRNTSLSELVRVLRPGGRLAVVDFMVVDQYPEILRRDGMRDVQLRPLGWRFWYGGPWLGASVVTGIKS
ncbi:MAG TPA: class I SAM-dependent methyltransferase [Candidatus Dormibacteraeota bacterium]